MWQLYVLLVAMLGVWHSDKGFRGPEIFQFVSDETLFLVVSKFNFCNLIQESSAYFTRFLGVCNVKQYSSALTDQYVSIYQINGLIVHIFSWRIRTFKLFESIWKKNLKVSHYFQELNSLSALRLEAERKHATLQNFSACSHNQSKFRLAFWPKYNKASETCCWKLVKMLMSFSFILLKFSNNIFTVLFGVVLFGKTVFITMAFDKASFTYPCKSSAGKFIVIDKRRDVWRLKALEKSNRFIAFCRLISHYFYIGKSTVLRGPLHV